MSYTPRLHEPLDHFHLFPGLPIELRLIIWSMAICPGETAKIHYYSLFNDENERRSSLPSMMANSLEPTRSTSLPEESTSFAWTDENRFLYYWNAGLRTACVESRQALSDYFRDVPKLQAPRPNDIFRVRGKGEHVYIEVARRDIVCFRFLEEDLITCTKSTWLRLLYRLPFSRHPRSPDLNLALEFHDSWNDGLQANNASIYGLLREPSLRGMAVRAFWEWTVNKIPQCSRMWLIDRSNRLPQNYEVGMPTGADGDNRYGMYENLTEGYGMHERLVGTPFEVFGAPLKDQTFDDGKHKYVHSYSWDRPGGFKEAYTERRDVPIMSFMWKVENYCFPFGVTNRLRSRHFFRVLRQLPGAGQAG
jgi:hypothetical protein